MLGWKDCLYVHHWLDLWRFLSWRHCMPRILGNPPWIRKEKAPTVLNAWWCCTGEHDVVGDGHQPVIGSLWDSPGVTFISPFSSQPVYWILLLLIYVETYVLVFVLKNSKHFPTVPYTPTQTLNVCKFPNNLEMEGFHSFDFSFGLSGWLWRFLWGRGFCDPLDGRWTGMMY